MKKKTLIVVVLLSVVALFLFIFLLSLFNFKEKPTYITEHSLGLKESIRFVYVNSSLSVSCIQIRKIDKKTKDEYLLETYQNYDNMIGYTLSNDTLTVFLRQGYWLNKSSSDFIKCDTFHLNINNIKWKIK